MLVKRTAGRPRFARELTLPKLQLVWGAKVDATVTHRSPELVATQGRIRPSD